MTALPVLAPAEDDVLLDAICDGNHAAFNTLVERYQADMIRLARVYVSSTALAEEAAQEAWIAILNGCRSFQRRSSLKTWMFRILINRAMTHVARETRADRFLNLPSTNTELFQPLDHPLAGSWIVPPRAWTPEERLLAGEVREKVEAAIASLPPLQRKVITLRDVCGWSAMDVCNLYHITESNQRVLLHRGRVRVRQSLEDFMSVEEASSCRPM